MALTSDIEQMKAKMAALIESAAAAKAAASAAEAALLVAREQAAMIAWETIEMAAALDAALAQAAAAATSTKKCTMCKHTLAITLFQKMKKTGMKEQKCCNSCLEKQAKRNAIYNPINNQKAKEERAAAKAAGGEVLRLFREKQLALRERYNETQRAKAV